MSPEARRLDVGWVHSGAAGALRELILWGCLAPLMALHTRRRVFGRDRLRALEGPVLFIANHSSHMDTPTVLAALPRRWRRRTAVAAAADYFYRKPLLAQVVSLAFNTVPVQRTGAAVVPTATSDITRLIDDGWNLIIYAEGTRSRDGTIGRLRPGAAVLAAEHDLPIVPVHVAGTHAVMPPGRKWMRRPNGARRPIEVRFGTPVRPQPGEHRAEVMERVRLFFEECGAVTTLDKWILARRRRSAAPSTPA